MLFQLIRNLLLSLGTTIGLTRFMGIEQVDARRLIVVGVFVAIVAYVIIWSLKLSLAGGA